MLICIVAYTCWIQESVNEIINALNKCIPEANYNLDTLKSDKEFLNAIRSFIFAHPFKTDRHSKFGFDGTLRCIDIRPNGKDYAFQFMKEEDKFYLDTNGKVAYNGQEVDYWLYIYNENKHDNKFKQFIGLSLNTILEIANDYVNFIYRLDEDLNQVKV